MPIYEFAIACVDEPEAHRKKEGDIISVKPYPWGDWGKKALKEYLIVIMDGLVRQEAQRLTIPLYNTAIDWFVSDPNVIETMGLEITAKRRYSIPFDMIRNEWLIDIDLIKTRDKTIKYQPFIDGDIIIDTRVNVICFDKYQNSFKYNNQRGKT